MAGAAAALPQLLSEALAQGDAEPRRYGRARLVGPDGAPLKSKAIPVGQNLIFHYPFAGTPCFLLDLGRPTRPRARLRTTAARAYEWHGGTGASGGVVAYSAICAHKLTYPTREISFISYRAEKTPGSRFARVIHCCSEHSQYDPADGGRVLAGPAPSRSRRSSSTTTGPRTSCTRSGRSAGRCSPTSSPSTRCASRSSTAGARTRRSRARAR